MPSRMILLFVLHVGIITTSDWKMTLSPKNPKKIHFTIRTIGVPMREHVAYECEVCHRQFRTSELALKCENSTMPNKPTMKVGQQYRNRYYPNRYAKLLDLYLGRHSLGTEFDTLTGHEWWGIFDSIIMDIDHYGYAVSGPPYHQPILAECDWEEIKDGN